MSKKEATRPPKFDETAAQMRKARELYGDNYQPVKAPLVQEERPKAGVTNCLDEGPKESRQMRKG